MLGSRGGEACVSSSPRGWICRLPGPVLGGSAGADGKGNRWGEAAVFHVSGLGGGTLRLMLGWQLN